MRRRSSRHGHLVRIEQEIDADLEAAEIQRRVYQAGGPALYFARVKGCRFPMVSNLFGTLERARFLFRDTLEAVRRLVELKVDPGGVLAAPVALPAACRCTALAHAAAAGARRAGAGPRRRRFASCRSCKCWPRDGGPFVTLPQVYTEDPDRPGLAALEPGHVPRAALGQPVRSRDREVGLHYQIHRGIGVHHAAAIRRGRAVAGERLRRRPAGDDAGRGDAAAGGDARAGLRRRARRPARAAGRARPSGPADARRRRLLHRGHRRSRRSASPKAVRRPPGLLQPGARLPGAAGRDASTTATDAIWPFTVVGRPPQEDTVFGAAHPRADRPGDPDGDARACRRSTPSTPPACIRCCWRSAASATCPTPRAREPQELLTQANAILGQGQLSLAKYLFIVAPGGRPGPRHPRHRRRSCGTCWSGSIWRRDLHFQTRTTIDTLDYSRQRAERRVEGGDRRRRPAAARRWPTRAAGRAARCRTGFAEPRVCLPGVLAVRAPAFSRRHRRRRAGGRGAALRGVSAGRAAVDAFPLVVLVDDSEFAARIAEQLPVGDVHALEPGGRHRTASARHVCTSTGAAAGRW